MIIFNNLHFKYISIKCLTGNALLRNCLHLWWYIDLALQLPRLLRDWCKTNVRRQCWRSMRRRRSIFAETRAVHLNVGGSAAITNSHARLFINSTRREQFVVVHVGTKSKTGQRSHFRRGWRRELRGPDLPGVIRLSWLWGNTRASL